MVRFPARRRAKLSLNIAPLLDVVFLLLLFFMLTSSFSQPAIAIKLPAGDTGERQEPGHVVVTADADGRVFVNQREVPEAALDEQLERALKAARIKDVEFRGDERIDYGLFVRVMNASRRLGARAIHVTHRAE